MSFQFVTTDLFSVFLLTYYMVWFAKLAGYLLENALFVVLLGGTESDNLWSCQKVCETLSIFWSL